MFFFFLILGGNVQIKSKVICMTELHLWRGLLQLLIFNRMCSWLFQRSMCFHVDSYYRVNGRVVRWLLAGVFNHQTYQ